MSPLDELYTEYSHIKTVKEKGLLSLDWNANKEWKNIVKYFCEMLDFKWSKGNDTNLYLYFHFLPRGDFSEEETKFIENYYGEWIILKIYPDKHSYLGEFKSNLLNKDTLKNFVFSTDAYRIPDSLQKNFEKIAELISNDYLNHLRCSLENLENSDY